MPNFLQASFANENPLSESGKYVVMKGVGVVGNASNQVAAASGGAECITRLNTSDTAFGRTAYAEIILNFGTGHLGVGLSSTATAATCGYTLLVTNSTTILPRRYDDSYAGTSNLTNVIVPTLTTGDKLGIEIVDIATPDQADINIYVNDVLESTISGAAWPDAITNAQPAFTGQATGTMVATQLLGRDAYAVGATISSSPAGAVLSSTLTFAIANGTAIGSGIPVGTVVDINGYPLTITSYPPSGTGNVVCDVDCGGLYDPLAILTYTDADTSSDQVLIDFQQQTGFDVVTLAGALATDNGYVLFGTVGFADGDQLEHETITNLTVLATSEWDWSTEPLVTVTMDWYLIDATDGVRTGPYTATYTVSALSLPISRRRREGY